MIKGSLARAESASFEDISSVIVKMHEPGMCSGLDMVAPELRVNRKW